MDLADGSTTTLIGSGLFDFGDVDGVGAEVRLHEDLIIHQEMAEERGSIVPLRTLR